MAELKRRIPSGASEQPAAQGANANGGESAAKDHAATSTIATKRSQSDEGSTKRRKTAQGSSALRDTRPTVTNNVYNILNSHKTIIYTNGAMPGDDFVPTLPPRKKSTAAAPTAKHKRNASSKAAPECKVQSTDPEVEEVEPEQEPAKSSVSSNTFTVLIEGVEYEIEEIVEDIADLAAWKVPKPMYSDRCLREERGKTCGRKSCKYVHEDQLYLCGHFIKTLYANAKEAKEAGA